MAKRSRWLHKTTKSRLSSLITSQKPTRRVVACAHAKQRGARREKRERENQTKHATEMGSFFSTMFTPPPAADDGGDSRVVAVHSTATWDEQWGAHKSNPNKLVSSALAVSPPPPPNLIDLDLEFWFGSERVLAVYCSRGRSWSTSPPPGAGPAASSSRPSRTWPDASPTPSSSRSMSTNFRYGCYDPGMSCFFFFFFFCFAWPRCQIDRFCRVRRGKEFELYWLLCYYLLY